MRPQRARANCCATVVLPTPCGPTISVGSPLTAAIRPSSPQIASGSADTKSPPETSRSASMTVRVSASTTASSERLSRSRATSRSTPPFCVAATIGASSRSSSRSSAFCRTSRAYEPACADVATNGPSSRSFASACLSSSPRCSNSARSVIRSRGRLPSFSMSTSRPRLVRRLARTAARPHSQAVSDGVW